MIKLSNALDAWPSGSFNQVLGDEIQKLGAGVLPLHDGTTQGGIVDDSDITVTVINAHDEDNTINAKIGVFFTEITGGCSCGDDPVPGNAYCEMRVIIDKSTADSAITVIQN